MSSRYIAPDVTGALRQRGGENRQLRDPRFALARANVCIESETPH